MSKYILSIKEYNFIRKYSYSSSKEIFSEKTYKFYADFIFTKALEKFLKYAETKDYFLMNEKIKTTVIKKICHDASRDLLKDGDIKKTCKIENIDDYSKYLNALDDLSKLEIRSKIEAILSNLEPSEKYLAELIMLESTDKSINTILKENNIDTNVYKDLYKKLITYFDK